MVGPLCCEETGAGCYFYVDPGTVSTLEKLDSSLCATRLCANGSMCTATVGTFLMLTS